MLHRGGTPEQEVLRARVRAIVALLMTEAFHVGADRCPRAHQAISPMAQTRRDSTKCTSAVFRGHESLGLLVPESTAAIKNCSQSIFALPTLDGFPLQPITDQWP
jgi:hypothetical protein